MPSGSGCVKAASLPLGGEGLVHASSPLVFAQSWEGHKMHAQPTETEPELCLSVSCGGMGQQWPATGALGAADLGMA